MKSKILATISILKVARDHVAEIKAHPVEGDPALGLVEDIEMGLGWVLKKLEKLHDIHDDRGPR